MYSDRPDARVTTEPSDYLMTLLRDPTSSHLLETIVSRSPNAVFDVVWQTYFSGKLSGSMGRKTQGAGGLALHPVANFVVARALERVSPEQLLAVCEELGGEGIKKVLREWYLYEIHRPFQLTG
jgi:nucleolar protein 9